MTPPLGAFLSTQEKKRFDSSNFSSQKITKSGSLSGEHVRS
jgi:hypothetical protein